MWIVWLIAGVVSLMLAAGAYRSITGAGARLGVQRLCAALWWTLLGVGLVLFPFSSFAVAFFFLAAPCGVGWALSASANKERMLPRVK